MKSKNYYYDALDSQEDYRQYLKKTYGVSDFCQIIIKNGYVMRKKEDVKEGDTNETRQQVYSDIEGETLRIYNLIDEANEEIYEQVQLQEVLEEPNEEVLNLELELVADDLFDNLSNSIRNLTRNAYESFLLRLDDSDDGSAESLKPFLGQTLLSEEIYDTINTWVNNLKTWFLDNIDAELNATSLHTQKSFLSEAIENVEEFFSKVKTRVEQLINNILSFVRTEAHKVKFKIQGVEKYEIVASVGDGTCQRCRDMDGQIFDVDELNVPETAPPFHPNCCCVMVPFVEDEVEEEEIEEEEVPTKDEVVYGDRLISLEDMQINAKYIYNYLRSEGWTHNAICAILGNMQVESTINPGSWQIGYDVGDMEAGFGLVQWTDAQRFFDWAEENDLDPYDIDVQLERILLEVRIGTGDYFQWNSSYNSDGMTFREFTQCDDLSPAELAEIFMQCYEQPGDPDQRSDPEDPESDSRHRRMNNAAYWDEFFS